MYESVGERLSYCRSLLGFSRQDFVAKFGGLSVPTLSRWELNYNLIPATKLNKLVEFFKKNGIEVSVEWILLNIGQAPINTNLQSFDKLNFDEISYITLYNLRNNVIDFEISQINNSFFEPLLYNGDYVGGVRTSNLETLNNKLCYVYIDKFIYAGIFNFIEMTITNFYKQTLKISSSSRIGAISCISKRL